MKVAIIGATGFVGTALTKELLDRNISVLAIARSADKLEVSNDNLEKLNIDVLDEQALTNAVNGADVVISAYNPGWTNPNIHEDYLKGAAAIQNAVEASDVKRVIVIGGAGTLQIEGNYLVDGPQFPAEIYPAASAVKKYFLETLKPSTKLDWAFFSPAIEMHPGITIGRTGKYRLGKTSPVFDEQGKCVLSVEDLSIVLADEVENPKHHQEQFTAAY